MALSSTSIATCIGNSYPFSPSFLSFSLFTRETHSNNHPWDFSRLFQYIEKHFVLGDTSIISFSRNYKALEEIIGKGGKNVKKLLRKEWYHARNLSKITKKLFYLKKLLILLMKLSFNNNKNLDNLSNVVVLILNLKKCRGKKVKFAPINIVEETMIDRFNFYSCNK